VNDTEKAFNRAIEADPLNEDLRAVFADFLEDYDRPEEGASQRQWVKAYHFIKQFTREQEDGGWKYDENDERIPDSLTFTYEKVMGEIEWWKECVTGKFTDYGLGGTIGFSTTYAQDELHDAETRREFWRCFQVLTGVEAPEDLRNQEWYRCAC
jgi:uncharacterized protein (TIGR02996 family)